VDYYENFHDMICKTRSLGFGKEVKRRILLGTYVLSSGFYDAYYKKAQLVRGKIIKEFNSAYKKCDVILTPTTPTTAFKVGYSQKDPIENYKAGICTVPVNIAGIAAVSFPCGFDEKQLPIGAQLIGPSFSEARLLNMVHKFEQETNRCYLKEFKIN
jgi:aspartyl-tRNA(Asn)/glutamyl-tRNA(Gln) amidotransferase subunit A